MKKNYSKKNKRKLNAEKVLKKHYEKNVLFGILIFVIFGVSGFIIAFKTDKTFLLPIMITFSIIASSIFSIAYYRSFKKSIIKSGKYNSSFIEKAKEFKLERRTLKVNIKFYSILIGFTIFMGYISWSLYYEDKLLEGELGYTFGTLTGTYSYNYKVDGRILSDKSKSSYLKYGTYFKLQVGDEYEVAYSIEDNTISKVNLEKPSNKQLEKFKEIISNKLNSSKDKEVSCIFDNLYKEFGLKGIAAIFYKYGLNNYLNDYLLEDVVELLTSKSFLEIISNCEKKL